MTWDRTQARREMFLHLQAALDAADWSALGPKPTFYPDGRDAEALNQSPEVATPNVRVYARPATGVPTAWTDNQKVWNEAGTLWIVCCGPLSPGNGLEVAEYQSIIASNAFRDKSFDSCVKVNNVRANYIGPSGGWYLINVLVDYYFDELR